MNITCPKDECAHEFKLDTFGFEVETESSGTHTTQHRETGVVSCPKCKSEIDVDYTYDYSDETDEILSFDISVS
ncbi:hypothetical protein [Shewanella putrefaciens]|uniref:hypothetical protein n=1 Tax=Shewanella putrefaciens TaxID=24 RepID=UPI0018E7BE6B|nr:hypothetical protein [Shewanella putrefaciens]